MAAVAETKKWLEIFTDKLIKNKTYLSKLDSDIGDGDHGNNLARGAKALQEKLSGSDYQDIATLFKDAGMVFVSKVGGASGPLYGSAFIGIAKAAQNSSDLPTLINAGLEGIQKRGKAKVGEKTMVDVWAPVLAALKANQLTQAKIETFVEKTKPLKATKGRASYLGERSVGFIDPGAASSGYFFESLLEAGAVK